MEHATTPAPKAVKLTINDPVSLEVLQEFNQLEAARHDIAMRLLALEQERVRLLAAAHQVDKQHERMFEKVLVDRGVAPNVPVEIDHTTGHVTLGVSAASAPETPKSVG